MNARMLPNLVGMMILQGMLVLAVSVAHAAPECYEAQDLLQKLSEGGYKLLIRGDEISLPAGKEREIADLGNGDRMGVREMLEVNLGFAQQAVTQADEAIRAGRIRPDERHEFVVTSRRLLYLRLREHGASPHSTAVMRHDRTKRGVVIIRGYDFPNEARDGEMAPSDRICIQARLENLTLWAANETWPAARFLAGRSERADCLDKSIVFVCDSLSGQLELARKDDETLYATATLDNMSQWFFLRSTRAERGRSLFASPDGTTFLVNRLYHTVFR